MLMAAADGLQFDVLKWCVDHKAGHSVADETGATALGYAAVRYAGRANDFAGDLDNPGIKCLQAALPPDAHLMTCVVAWAAV